MTRKFQITVSAEDPSLGMTAGEVVSALADVSDRVVPTVRIGWNGRIKEIIVAGTEPDGK